MAVSVQLHSTDAASGERRTITIVKTGASTASAYYESSSDPGNVKQFDLSSVSADPGQGKIKATYGLLVFGVTATGTVVHNPPSVTADVGSFGQFHFPVDAGDDDRIIDFLRHANFPALV